MTDLRRARQCHRDGCDSEARWRLHLHLQCVGVGRDRITIQAPTSIYLCNDKKHHKAALEYLMSEHNKGAITTDLLANSYPPPDWSSATAVFEPVDPAALIMDVA